MKELLEALPYVDMDYQGEFWDQEGIDKYFPAIEADRAAAAAGAKS